MATITQSPEWDANVSLDDMLGQAKFFLICKGSPTLVEIVHGEHIANGNRMYDTIGLSHDRYGVTYDGDGSVDSTYIGELLTQGKVELTCDREAALQWIDDVMNCRN